LVRCQVAVVFASALLSILAFPLVFLPAGIAAASCPPLLLKHHHRKRVERIEQQLDGWLLMLSNALRATPSVGDAIKSTVTLTSGDLNRELDVLVKELKLGVPVDRALRTLSERVASDTVTAALTTIVVAGRTGGELSTALEQSAASLRESARLEGVLRTKTAEGRGQVLVLAGAPFILCGVIAWLEPSWFDTTLEHPLGRVLLVACGALWLAATTWAYHIVDRASS
jgi:tight adherence protein B